MWKDLSPAIYRKRMIIEGKPSIKVTKKQVNNYLKKLSKILGMKLVMGPLTRENPRYGISSYIYWEESGTHFYYWDKPFPFLSVDIYTCKRFKSEVALSFTKNFFKIKNVVWKDISFKK